MSEQTDALRLRRMPDYPGKYGTTRWFIGGRQMDYTLTVTMASGGDDEDGQLVADAIERLWAALHLLRPGPPPPETDTP